MNRRTCRLLALLSPCVLACSTHGSTDGSWRATDAAVPPTYTFSPAKQNKVSKIDLLFMIDNSSSMADKQAILAQAVPDLVNRLVDPVCIDPMTGAAGRQRATPTDRAPWASRDFDPVKDIHIGIISSSLGGHGATGVCDEPDPRKTFPHNDDQGHLLARGAMDVAVADVQNKGFLNWNPVARHGTQMPRTSRRPSRRWWAASASTAAVTKRRSRRSTAFSSTPIRTRRSGRPSPTPAARRRGARRHRHGAARSSAPTSCGPTRWSRS